MGTAGMMRKTRKGAMGVTTKRTAQPVIRVLAAAAALWLVCAPAPAYANGLPSGVDPVRAAHDVFQDADFWWKRIEARPVSTSWLEWILGEALKFGVRVCQAIWDLIAKLLRSLFSVFGGASSGDSLVVWLIIVALLAWASWKIYPAILNWLKSRSSAPTAETAVTWQTLAEAADLFDQAGAAFRNGTYAESIRLALLALIARLEKQGLLRYDTTRTNREYQVELRRSSELAACFGQLARIYERVWYGRRSAERAEAEQAINLCGSVINREDLASE
jgi:Domain of unknown function (DUF4129)